MLLVDDLLMLPFSGFGFILRTLQRVAEQEYTDDQPVKERLLELQLRLESGEITEHQYEREEARLLTELRDIRERRRALAGAPPREEDRGLVFTAGETEASVSVNFHQDRGRKSRG
jgi:Gas vesicle protein G